MCGVAAIGAIPLFLLIGPAIEQVPEIRAGLEQVVEHNTDGTDPLAHVHDSSPLSRDNILKVGIPASIVAIAAGIGYACTRRPPDEEFYSTQPDPSS